jgi:hypothetical protein
MSASIVILRTEQACPGASRARSVPLLLLLSALTLVASAAANASPGTTAQPLQTAIVDPTVFTGPDADSGLARAAAAGVSVIKVPLFWNGVAPAKRPAGFQPASPSDPSYYWTALDTQLRLIRSHGLEPLVYIAGAPAWAIRPFHGTRRVDSAQYEAFAQAAARRYSGTFHGLPRVRYWQAWNEPNKVVDPAAKVGVESWYRTLVNGFATSVHRIPGNVVVAGGLSPFGISTAVAPMTFMRNLLCIPPDTSTKADCASRIHFDVWSVDPYTAGGPSHLTAKPDDISVAELPAMKAVLDEAVRQGRIASTQPMRFWVTEFAWDSNPPDPGGVPLALEGRWVADALHRMWAAGVSLVTWFTLRDQPLRTSAYQSGLYLKGKSFASDIPKPALTAFRFPFVADPAPAKRITVWGRTPTSTAGAVQIEQQEPSSWKRLATLQASPAGIFSGSVASSGQGPLRAVFPAAKATSLPYSLVSPPDQSFQPFGAQATASGASPTSSAVSQYVEGGPGSGGSAVLPAAGAGTGHPARSVPAAVASAIGGAGLQAVAFGIALAAVLALFVVAAVRRKAPEEAPL